MRDMRCILRIAMQVIHHVIDKIEYSWDAKRTLKSSAENQLKSSKKISWKSTQISAKKSAKLEQTAEKSVKISYLTEFS